VPLPRFPDARLDVALAVDVALPAADVRAAIERAGKGLVRETELFDLYTGDQVGEGKKSLAWHVRLQAADRTLSEADGERFLDRLEREIGRLGGVLRRE
jgi:phenylalanyl-tRNA synthetase beta chain